MCQMLLSINPQYVAGIFSGKKKYEYRKFRCRKDVDRIIIYSTAPVKRVVGEVDIVGIVEDTLDMVWELTKEFSGISRDFFDEYYKGKERAVAYHLGKLRIYDHPLTLADIGVSCAPQSYRYIQEAGTILRRN